MDHKENMVNITEENCTHDCSTCGGSCTSGCGENGEPKKSIFDVIDTIAEELGKDEVQEMLEKLAGELEKEG